MPDETGAINLSPQEPELVDQTPLAQRMYEAIAPHVQRYYLGLEVVGIDVLYSAFQMQTPAGPQLQSGYVFLMTVRGTLIGPQHYITNMHLLPPSVPTPDIVEEMIRISTERLRTAKASQAMLNGQAPQ